MQTVGNLKIGQYLFSIPRCASSPFSWAWTTILDLSTISLFSTSCQNLQLVLCFHDEFPRLLLSLPTSTSLMRHFSVQALLQSFLLFLPWAGFQVYLCAWIFLKYHCHSAIPLLCGCVSSQSCPTLCDPKDCNPPGSYVCGILQVRILEWVALLLSRESSWPWDWTWVSCIADRFFTVWANALADKVTCHPLTCWIKSKFCSLTFEVFLQQALLCSNFFPTTH